MMASSDDDNKGCQEAGRQLAALTVGEGTIYEKFAGVGFVPS